MLDSLTAQTLENMEIIIVDDGSPDGCPAICDEYAARDARMKVVHKENGGLLSARKAGLAASIGDYIGFVDGDDWVEPDTFLNMYKAACEHSPDMVLSDFLCDYGDRAEPSSQCFENGFYDRDRLEKEIFPRMLFGGRFYSFGVNPNCWSKLVRRELIEKNLLPVDERIRMGEDAAFIYPCLLDSQSISCLKTPTYHYRITGQSMSTAYDEKLKDIILLPYKRLKEKNAASDFDISSQLDYYLCIWSISCFATRRRKPIPIRNRSAGKLLKISARMKIFALRRQRSIWENCLRTRSCSHRRSNAALCL